MYHSQNKCTRLCSIAGTIRTRSCSTRNTQEARLSIVAGTVRGLRKLTSKLTLIYEWVPGGGTALVSSTNASTNGQLKLCGTGTAAHHQWTANVWGAYDKALTTDWSLRSTGSVTGQRGNLALTSDRDFAHLHSAAVHSLRVCVRGSTIFFINIAKSWGYANCARMQITNAKVRETCGNTKKHTKHCADLRRITTSVQLVEEWLLEWNL